MARRGVGRRPCAIRRTAHAQVDVLLHHGDRTIEVPAHASGTDLISGRRVTAGEALTLDPTDVVVLRRETETG